MAGVDADAHRLLDELGASAPQPVVVGEVRVVRPALAVPSVAGRAVVAEELPSGAAHGLHEGLVGEDRVVVFGLDAAHPVGPLALRLDDPRLDRLPLVDAEKTLGVGRSQRPGRHEEPPDDRPDVGHDQEHQDAARNRRVQLLDAVPLVAGRLAAADGIAFLHFHGLSSRSRMLCLARSKRFRFDGQKV